MNHAPVFNHWEIVVVFIATIFCSAACVIVPFFIISRNEKMISALSGGSPIYLRFITVILVVWATCLLAMQDRIDEGSAAIFGMIVGYVFGAVNKQIPPGHG
jgi:hypothetical protein